MRNLRRLPAVILALLVMGGSADATLGPAPLTGAFDPEQVLVQLEKAVEERDWKRYGEFLAPDFRFVPFDAVRLEYPAVMWDEWGRAREMRFVEELVSPNHGATISLRDNVLIKGQESRGRAEWDLVYSLNSRGQVFRSRAIFVFEKVDNLWYLLEWIDTTIENREDSESPLSTSGTLRGALR
jgi:hypothetical protein